MTPEERKRLELELELLNLEKEKAQATQSRPQSPFLARGYDMAANAQSTPPQMRASLPGATGPDRMTNRTDSAVLAKARQVEADIASATRKARVAPVDKRANAAADAAMAEFGKKLDNPFLMAMGGNAMQIAGRDAAENVYEQEGVVSSATAHEANLLNSIALGLPAILNKDARQFLAQATADRPLASLSAQVIGSLAPLSGMFTAGRAGANAAARGFSVPVPFTGKTITTPNLIPRGGDAASRLTRYSGSLANDAGNTALGTATYQAMINEPIQSAAEGRELTLGSMGEAGARGFTDPFNLIPLAASGTMRTWNALTSGVATPSPKAAQMVNQYGVGPRQTPGSAGIAQTAQQFGGRVRPQDIRGLTNIENALRFALRDVPGVNVNARIADGFQRIRQSLPLVDDPTMNLARLIEREFAEDAPQIRAIIRNFLGKVGTDSSAGETIVGGAANQMRGAQADVLEQEAMSVFGNQPKQNAKEVLEQNLELLGEETYAPIMRAATSAPPQAQQRAASLVNRRPEADDILFNRADREGLTVEDYIARNPLEALHWVQSDLAKQARALRAANNPDTALEGVIQNMKTVLRDNVPNYREADALYASNARALGRLGTTRGPDAGVEGELKYDPGFGEGLLGPGGAAGRAEGRATASNVYEGMDERSRRAAAISVREVILDDLNKARAAGDEQRYEIAARFSKLNSEGALQALVDVFGDEGRRIVNRIRQFVDANEFARDIDPITGSNTKNKFTAAQTGAQPFAGPMGQATQGIAGSLGQNAVGDAFLMASGITSAPVMSAIRFAPFLADRLQPGRRTQRNIAETLLRRGQIGSQVQPPPRGPGPIEPLNPTTLPGYRPPGGSAPPQGNPLASNGVHASIMSGLMPSRPPSFVSAPGQAMRSALAGGATPLPGPGNKLIPPAPAVGPIGNQSAEETFFSTAPTTAPPPIRVKGMSKADGNKHGLMPHLRMQTSQPPTGKAKLVQDTNAANAPRQIAELDGILKAHPNALESPQGWAKMMSDALGSDDVPVAPYAFIRDMKDGTAQKTVQSLTPGQIADADHGFSNAAKMKEVYISGRAKPSDTGSLFAWGFLSRGVSPYTQESLFIDAFNGLGKWIDDAANGTFDIDAYLKWAKTAAPKGSNQPGAGASHNLNAFGSLFLQRMSEIMPGTNISKMEYLHNLMSDPNMTGPQIRREFARIGQGVGIDNKVVSFTLLVSGRDDVMVLDRVQIRKLWNDGRFDGINLYDGHKVDGAVVTGSALSNLTYGARGLLVYEAIERHLAKNLKNIYAGSGREAKASIGRYHWETWVADSQQEASHGTLDAILKRMVGDEDPMAGVVAKQGEYGSYSYGARYGRDAAGAPFIDYPTPSGATYRMTPQDFAAFREQMKKASAGIIPRGKFSVSDAGDQPWYNKEGVNKSALDDLAAQYGRRTDNGSVSGIDGGPGQGQDFANGRQNDLSGAAGKQQKGSGQSAATKERRTVGKPKKPSKIGTRAADAAAIAAVVGAPIAEADTGTSTPEMDKANQRVAVAEKTVADTQGSITKLQSQLEMLQDPNGDPKQKQRVLIARGHNLGTYGEKGDGVDGDLRPGGYSFNAIKAEMQKIEAEMARTRGELEKAQAEEAAARKAVTREQMAQSLMEAEKGIGSPLFQTAADLTSGAAFLGGVYLAGRARGGAVKEYAKSARTAATNANRLLNSGRYRGDATVGPNSSNVRAANLNEFWKQGGAKSRVPFTADDVGQLSARKGAKEPSQLFKAPRYIDNDKKFIIATAIESQATKAAADHFAEEAEKAQKEMDAAYADNDRVAYDAAVKARNLAAGGETFFRVLERLGYGLAAGRALSGLKKYPAVNANIKAAEAERNLILQGLQKQKTVGAKP